MPEWCRTCLSGGVSNAKLIFFDCDSTLSAIEGIDELARLRGEDCFARVEAMTRDAMDGKVPINEVFDRRLEIIRPTRDEVARIGQKYIETIEPTAITTLATVRRMGWTPIILSAGYTQAIAPLAEHLGIERIEAVDLYFNPDGTYRDFDRDYSTTRTRGKPEVISRLRRELQAGRVVMVGDGVSDMETQPVVDLFIGFGRYADRPAVRSTAGRFILSFQELAPLLQA